MRLTDIADSAIITRYGKHSHKNFEITLVLQGNMTIKLDDKTFQVNKGDVILIPPNTDHEGMDGVDYMNVFLQANNLDFYDVPMVAPFGRPHITNMVSFGGASVGS